MEQKSKIIFINSVCYLKHWNILWLLPFYQKCKNNQRLSLDCPQSREHAVVVSSSASMFSCLEVTGWGEATQMEAHWESTWPWELKVLCIRLILVCKNFAFVCTDQLYRHFLGSGFSNCFPLIVVAVFFPLV